MRPSGNVRGRPAGRDLGLLKEIAGATRLLPVPAPLATFRPTAIRTLIIDDEESARSEVRALLARRPEYAVVGVAATFDDARRHLLAGGYDLVILDVELAGDHGLELVAHAVLGAQIVFVATSLRHAVDAFEVDALDYLVKPVTTGRFSAALARFASRSLAGPRKRFLCFEEDTHSVIVQTGRGSRLVPYGQIAAILSHGNYSRIVLHNGDRLLARRTLKEWENLVSAAQFMRVHRQALVSLSSILGWHRNTRETLQLRIQGMTGPVAVSRRYLGGLIPHLSAAPARANPAA